MYLEAIPRRYLPRRYILDCRNNPFSKSRSLLQRKREPGSGKNRRRFLLRDKSGYRCRYQMYSAQDDKSYIFSAILPLSPKGIALCPRQYYIYICIHTSRVQRPKFQLAGSWNRALSCFLRIGALYSTFIQLCTRHTPDTKITDYKSVFYISETCINYIFLLYFNFYVCERSAYMNYTNKFKLTKIKMHSIL